MSTTEPVCGNCRWHHDLTGQTEGDGLKNCLAQPYPLCLSMVSLTTARCNLPRAFSPVAWPQDELPTRPEHHDDL